MSGSASALIKHQRYAHAKQFKRANRMLRRLRTMLGRVGRDISRKIAGDDRLCGPPSRCRSPGPARTEQRRGDRAAARSTACMPRRSSASAKARPTGPMSSA